MSVPANRELSQEPCHPLVLPDGESFWGCPLDGVAMMRARLVGALVSTIFAATLATRDASADAIPPPMPCPPDKVAITNHGGTHCVAPPPKDCPVGRRGVAGGTCDLHTCNNDDSCSDGKVCRQTSLCYARNEYWWGPCPPGKGDPFFLGLRAPPRPQCKLDEPTISYAPVSMCGVAPCNAPSECRPGGVCALPTAKLGAPPPPSATVTPTATTTTPTATNSTLPPAKTSSRGCGAGCAGLPLNDGRGAGGLALGLALVWLWRRNKPLRR